MPSDRQPAQIRLGRRSLVADSALPARQARRAGSKFQVRLYRAAFSHSQGSKRESAQYGLMSAFAGCGQKCSSLLRVQAGRGVTGILRPGTLAVLAVSQLSISSLRFSRRFLPIPIDREAPSYQPLDLSLAVRLVFFFLAVADVLSFGACTTVRSFLDMYRRPLVTSSNFVDCITGRSPGFAPLRSRPT